MPQGDGTGPGGGGAGRGRDNGFGLGPGGYCACPKCGKTVPHQRGVQCFNVRCPGGGSPMTRAR